MTNSTGLRRSRATLAAFLAAATVLTACAGAASTPSAEPSEIASATPSPSEPAPTATSTPTPTQTPEPTPEGITATSATLSLPPSDPPPDFVNTIACEGEIGPSDQVAIVRLTQNDPSAPNPLALRTYADLSAPRTVCTFGTWVVDLIDARHVLISEGGYHAVVDLPEVRYHWFRLPEIDGGSSTVLAVSPDLDAILWTRWVADPLTRTLMRTTASGDEVVTELPAVEGGRCGSPTDSNQADYQHAGRYAYVLDQIMLSLNTLVVMDGPDAVLELNPHEEGWSDPASQPTFPVWSPVAEVLYYRLGDDVMQWTPEGGSELFLADTPWFHPSITSDGRYLAYIARSDLHLLDLTTGANPEVISTGVLRSAFVNDAQLWFQADSGMGCAGMEFDEWIYAMSDGSVAPSIIELVHKAWPATSSSY